MAAAAHTKSAKKWCHASAIPDLRVRVMTDQAAPGTLSVVPSAPMQEALERDYNAMAGMIMGPVPVFADVMAAIAGLEERLNDG